MIDSFVSLLSCYCHFVIILLLTLEDSWQLRVAYICFRVLIQPYYSRSTMCPNTLLLTSINRCCWSWKHLVNSLRLFRVIRSSPPVLCMPFLILPRMQSRSFEVQSFIPTRSFKLKRLPSCSCRFIIDDRWLICVIIRGKNLPYSQSRLLLFQVVSLRLMLLPLSSQSSKQNHGNDSGFPCMTRFQTCSSFTVRAWSHSLTAACASSRFKPIRDIDFLPDLSFFRVRSFQESCFTLIWITAPKQSKCPSTLLGFRLYFWSSFFFWSSGRLDPHLAFTRTQLNARLFKQYVGEARTVRNFLVEPAVYSPVPVTKTLCWFNKYYVCGIV